MNFVRKFMRDRRAIGIMTIGMAMIGITIGVVVMGSLLPEYLTALTNATYTGAPAAVKTMMTVVLGIAIAAAIILVVFNSVRKR